VYEKCYVLHSGGGATPAPPQAKGLPPQKKKSKKKKLINFYPYFKKKIYSFGPPNYYFFQFGPLQNLKAGSAPYYTSFYWADVHAMSIRF
jgi:hypothetical protein